MTFDAWGSLFIVAGLAGCGIIALFIVGKILFIRLHLALRREGLADEHQRLGHKLPPDSMLPHVVVQLPVYNEGEIVRRSIAAAAALDWPKEKLHIQVCDDSTDDTARYVGIELESLRSSGIDITLRQRSNRIGFKAGSLRAAMDAVPHEYFAIFDVDYIPAPDFLRRGMAAFLSGQDIAFVQARFDFLNRNENALTRAQAIELDAHYAFEQATRSWAKLPLPFNGTGGIWRRAAIETAGGWQGKTIAEDMELSYAAWLKGWRGLLLTSLAVPGELPSRLKDWSSQQARWLAGAGQVLRSALPALLRDRSLFQKIIVVTNTATWWLTGAVNFVIAVSAAALLLDPSSAKILLPAEAAVLLALVGVLFVEFRLGNILLHGRQQSLLRFGGDFLLFVAFLLYKLGLHIAAVCKVFLFRKHEFVRTPKRGVGEINS